MPPDAPFGAPSGVPSNASTHKLYTVTGLAAELGVTARAIRLYEDKGLLRPSRVGSARVFSYRDRARMLLILRGKRLGFSLRDIKQFLDLYDVDSEHDEQKRILLRKVRERIASLRAMSAAINDTLDELRSIELQASEALER